MHKSNIVTRVIVILILCGTIVFAQKKCMFIGATPGVGGKISENARKDSDIMPKIKEWGYTVDKKHNCQDVLKYTAKDFEPYDFIFLSESIHSDQIKESLRKIPLPMLNSDGFGAKEGALAFYSGSRANISGPKPIVFLEEGKDHPLAAGIAPGTVKDLCTHSGAFIIWSNPTIPKIPIAAVASDKSQLMVYGIEKGTKNTKGYEIPHRVVTIGLHCFGYATLTETGVKLYKAGIEWILGGGTALKMVNYSDPTRLNLSQSTTSSFHYINFFLPEQTYTKLTVWNNMGRKVRTLTNGLTTAGQHHVLLDASTISKGMYYINLDYGNGKLTTILPLVE